MGLGLGLGLGRGDEGERGQGRTKNRYVRVIHDIGTRGRMRSARVERSTAASMMVVGLGSTRTRREGRVHWENARCTLAV